MRAALDIPLRQTVIPDGPEFAERVNVVVMKPISLYVLSFYRYRRLLYSLFTNVAPGEGNEEAAESLLSS